MPTANDLLELTCQCRGHRNRCAGSSRSFAASPPRPGKTSTTAIGPDCETTVPLGTTLLRVYRLAGPRPTAEWADPTSVAEDVTIAAV